MELPDIVERIVIPAIVAAGGIMVALFQIPKRSKAGLYEEQYKKLFFPLFAAVWKEENPSEKSIPAILETLNGIIENHLIHAPVGLLNSLQGLHSTKSNCNLWSKRYKRFRRKVISEYERYRSLVGYRDYAIKLGGFHSSYLLVWGKVAAIILSLFLSTLILIQSINEPDTTIPILKENVLSYVSFTAIVISLLLLVASAVHYFLDYRRNK